MLDDLFVNTTIILSFIFVGAQLFKNISLKEPLSFEVKCFVGIAMGTLGASIYRDSPQQFIQLADDALYSSKRNGSNQVSAVS
jgi:GGDEF domain-containing protein